ncbi:MAG: DEAD/DEAH box helicase [Actinomycetota bacterium]
MFEDGERLEVLDRFDDALVVAVHGRSGIDHLPFADAARALVSVPADAAAHPSVLALAEAVRTARELTAGAVIELDRRRRLDRALRDEAAVRFDDVVAAVARDEARHHVDAVERPRARLVVEVVAPDDSDTWRARLGLDPPGEDGPVVSAHELPAAGSVAAARLGGRPAVDLRRGLRTLAEVWSDAAGRWPRGGRPVDDALVIDLLGPLGARLALAGIGVAWPGGAPEHATADRVVAAAGLDARRPLSGLAAVALPVDVRVRLGAAVVADAPPSGGLVRVDDRWALCPPAPVGATTLRLADLVAGAEVELDDRLATALAELRGAGKVEQGEPARLRAELRPYQRRGLHWLMTLTGLGLGGCLADDMGLGKTIQVIALHLLRRERGLADAATLVVAPTSLIDVWVDELRRFAPGVVVHRHHGARRSLGAADTGDVVVTSYGVVRRDRDLLAARDWDLVVADEAQVLANPTSETARSLRRLRAGSRIALTGTPIQNRLGDLWALLDWCVPGLLGSAAEFDRRHARPIVRGARSRSAAELDAIIGPVVLRRTKTDPAIVPDLPGRRVVDHEVGLSDEQRRLYETAVDELLGEVRSSSGIERRGRVLRLLTTLKQICNHPSHHLRDGGPTVGRSGKLDLLDDLLDGLLGQGEPVVVVSQYVEMLDLLAAHLGRRGVSAAALTGRLAPAARHRIVDRFQRGEVPVLLLSLRAGGTGLTLTRAAHLVHFDRWWNPAVEDQASDRIWRIGQTRPVTVHRLISLGTVEQRIDAVLAGKRRVADAVLGGSAGARLAELDDAELGELVTLGPTAGGAGAAQARLSSASSMPRWNVG